MAAIRKYCGAEDTYKHQHNLKINFKRNCFEEILWKEFHVPDNFSMNIKSFNVRQFNSSKFLKVITALQEVTSLTLTPHLTRAPAHPQLDGH